MNGLYGEVIEAKKDISRVETNSRQSKEATEERGCEEITSKPNKIFDNFNSNTTINIRYVSSRNRIGNNNFIDVDKRCIPNEISSRAGAVAQLGEHRTCTAEVAGSNPVSSTKTTKEKR